MAVSVVGSCSDVVVVSCAAVVPIYVVGSIAVVGFVVVSDVDSGTSIVVCIVVIGIVLVIVWLFSADDAEICIVE